MTYPQTAGFRPGFEIYLMNNRKGLGHATSVLFMSEILNIAVHHSGGVADDQYSSSARLTPILISSAHKERWNFPSRYMKDADGNSWYAGYNCIYDPKTRAFTQTRAIGEETAAQYGFNFNTFSVCIIGNYMTKPSSWPRASVDLLTEQIKLDITLFLHDLIDGNKRGLYVVPGTKLSLDVSRVHPHRFYQQTSCYGDFMDDNMFRDLLIAWKPIPAAPPAVETQPTEPQLEKRNALIQIYLQLVAKLQDILLEMQKKKNVGRLGVVGGRSCEGLINLKP